MSEMPSQYEPTEETPGGDNVVLESDGQGGIIPVIVDDDGVAPAQNDYYSNGENFSDN